MLNVFLTTGKATRAMQNLIIEKYKLPVYKLSIQRSEFCKLIDIYAKDIYDYEFCVRPAYQFPFITEGDITYLPLPHLLYRATTSSLLYRLTENNQNLRSKIGKEVVETYLLQILTDSGAYEEVLPEKKYHVKGVEYSTPDVMVKNDSEYLFFESKSAVPSIGMRIFDSVAVDKYIKRLTEAIEQLYKQIKRFINRDYNFFRENTDASNVKEHTWGVVTILEDAYVSRILIYERFSQIADIPLESEEYQWVINHIKVLSLYDVEKYAFIGESIINHIITLSEKKQPYDYSLTEAANKTIINQSLMAFKKETVRPVEEVTKLMISKGLVGK